LGCNRMNQQGELLFSGLITQCEIISGEICESNSLKTVFS
jgi:hypothetical protein